MTTALTTRCPATRPPFVVWLGLAVVLAAAAVLSFSALRDLAIAVRIDRSIAWLLPISIDAGAAVSCSVWLGGRTHEAAAHLAGKMTWALLAVTVLGNATAQGMASAQIVPPWWVAVLVGAVPPAIVGEVVRLVVLLIRRADNNTDTTATNETEVDQTTPDVSPTEEDTTPPTVTEEPAESALPRPVLPRPVLRLTQRRPDRSRPNRTNVPTDEQALAQARQWVASHDGRLPSTRAERREATGCGGDRADRLAAQLTAERNVS